MSSRAEVKQYTASFSAQAANLTIDYLGNTLKSADYDEDTQSYDMNYTLLDGRKLLIPVGAHIINGTGRSQRIGNRISVKQFIMKALIKNAANYAPVLKLSLIYDNGVNGSDRVNINDLYDAADPDASHGDCLNTIPRLSGNGRFTVLKSAVFEVYNETANSVAYMSWDLTMDHTLIYREWADNNNYGLTNCNNALYILVSVASDSACSLNGIYSILYTDY